MELEKTVLFCKQEIFRKATKRNIEFLTKDIIDSGLDEKHHAVFLKCCYGSEKNEKGEWVFYEIPLVWMEYPQELVKLDSRNNLRFFVPSIKMRIPELVYLIDVETGNVKSGG